MRQLELLAPAKNAAIGMAAIDHGADAVYIGAPRFGARAMAGNSVDDIRSLVSYAHPFGAKVYVTVNTLVFDDEIAATRQLLRELADAGVDAVLVQDMAVLQLIRQLNDEEGCALALHASTQTDNRSAENAGWLHSIGFSRVVLARELSVEEIAAVHRQVPDVELEVFVHGALCVSYSGLCYASQYCFSRSANRGECAQFCRMKFDLLDADNRVVEHQRYLLSLKDMNQIDNLERLARAGATSFKIEGRLKDIDYVKNVTAAYSMRLDALIARHPDQYERASRGRVTYAFQPNLQKTFHRGYTTYFADGRQAGMASFDTPKAVGEPVGSVKEVGGSFIVVRGTARFCNGDGLCFMNSEHQLEGFRVNRVDKNRLFLLKVPKGLRQGMPLYRNNDQEFSRVLSKKSAERKIPVTMALSATDEGYQLRVNDTVVSFAAEHQLADKPQREYITCQLTKLGGTPYTCRQVSMPDDFNYFIPGSLLAQMRRKALGEMEQAGVDRALKTEATGVDVAASSVCVAPPSYQKPFLYNISNSIARQFYQQQGLEAAEKAFELQQPSAEPLIMQCRYCLRHALGFCVKHGGRRPEWREPLSLRLGDGRRFRLEFDCTHCQMNVYAIRS